MLLSTSVGAALVLAAARPAPPARPVADSIGARIDSVFAAYTAPGSGGCSVAAARDGRSVFAKGYGLASIELGVPITPRSVFNVGSIAKGVTALGVVMLARERRLSLDDDIREYVPELPAYATPVRVRHLLQQTSGLADNSELFRLAGYNPWVDAILARHQLELVAAVPRTIFRPGTRYQYSNTNYDLLALIVERVTRQPFRAFAAERIFAPLGMSHTRFPRDYDEVIAHRVSGYIPGTPPTLGTPNSATAGASNLFTTAEDLLLWSRNLATGRVGGTAATQAIAAPLALPDGTVLPNGYGIARFVHHGRPALGFSGGHGGYSADFVHVPGDAVDVAVLCNMRINSRRLSRSVLDIVLPAEASLATDAPRAGSSSMDSRRGEAAVLAPYVGVYWSTDANQLLTLAERRGALAVVVNGDSTSLARIEDRVYRSPSGTIYELLPRASGGAPSFIRRGDGRQRDRFERRQPPRPTATFERYAGAYRNEALELTLRFVLRGDTLFLAQHRYPDVAVNPVFADAFDDGQSYLLFRRSAAGAVAGLTVTNERLGPVEFVRLPLRDRPA